MIIRLAITSNPICKDTAIEALGQLDSKWRFPTKHELFTITHSIGNYWVCDTGILEDAYTITIMWGGPIQERWSAMAQLIPVKDIG
jgi:hypothetical protein